MKKGRLKMIPYLNADEKDREFLMLYGHPYLAKPELTMIDDEKVLILNVYQRELLQKGFMEPVYRVFQGKKEFITERTCEGEWTVLPLKRLLGDYGGNDVPRIVMRLKREERMVKGFFRKGQIKKRAIVVLYEKQGRIKERESLQRRRIKEKKCKRLFSEIKPFSSAFIRWLDDQAMYDSQYIFYEYSRKKHIPCICTHCRAEFELDRSVPRHNRVGTCPVCRRPARFKARGKMKSGTITDRGEAVKIERIGQGILMRHLSLSRSYKIDRPETWETIYYEDYRAILEEHGRSRYFKAEYVWNSGYRETQWKETYLPDHFYYNYHFPRTVENYERLKYMPGTLYTRNLGQCLSVTGFRYSGLPLYAKKYRNEEIAVKRYLEAYLEFPQLEYFIKAGFYQISNEIIWHRANKHIDFQAKGLKQALQISKEEILLLRKYDLGSDYVELFQKMEKNKVKLNETEKMNFLTLYGINDVLLSRNLLASIRKITTYLAKQLERCQGRRGYRLDSDLPELSKEEEQLHRNIAGDWLDYISWSEILGHDVKSRAVLFPKELNKAHDRLHKEYQKFQKKEEDKKLRKMRSTADRMFREERKLMGGQIEKGDYLFVPPQRWQELRKEGDALGHCVGSYVEHIAKKHCSVYFIRKKKEPEEPFYTVEIQNGRVTQCQGKSRCVPTKEVEEFLTYAIGKLRDLKEAGQKAA